MSKYDVDIADAWAQAYAKPHGDPHHVFATLLGVGRNEAKHLAYEYMWSDEGKKCRAIQQFHQVSEETRFVYRYFADLMGRGGLAIAVPQLQEIFNMMED